MDGSESLYEYLKSGKQKVPRSEQRAEAAASVPGFTLEGFERIGEFAYRRRYREPDPLAHWGTEGDALRSARAPVRDLVFFDTETTGLSGGAGNLAFLVGVGRIDGADLAVEQYFLADFPGEAEFLSLLRPLFDPAKTFVSYNGSAFDSHLLASRFSLNRLSFALGRQYDLLHPTRRLWKASAGVCSLKNIERQVLGFERGDDIDGAEVPEYYFRFLRSGNASTLEPVFFHNRLDVVSLARLLGAIESVYREPEALLEAAPESRARPDPAAVGALLIDRAPDRAENFLTQAFAAGHTGSGRVLGYWLKRRREFERAFGIWEQLFSLSRQVQAGVELAMHLEHRARDPLRALEVVRSLLAGPDALSGPDRRSLETRRARLERKVNRK